MHALIVPYSLKPCCILLILMRLGKYTFKYLGVGGGFKDDSLCQTLQDLDMITINCIIVQWHTQIILINKNECSQSSRFTPFYSIILINTKYTNCTIEFMITSMCAWLRYHQYLQVSHFVLSINISGGTTGPCTQSTRR